MDSNEKTDAKKLYIEAINRRLVQLTEKELDMVLKFIFALLDFREVTK